jgi:hypothetical protein
MFQEWHPSSAEIAAMIILAIFPLTIPVSILWRCAIWSVAWGLLLHLFIWQWKVAALWPSPVKISLAIGLTGLLVACTYVPIFKIWREEKAAALSGELEPSCSTAKFDDSDVKVQIGTGPNGTIISWIGGKKEIFSIVGDKLLIRRENGKLLLTVDVRERGTGAVIVSITDNKWTVSSAQNVSWDHNYTDNALEVKDGRGRIVLQVVLMPGIVHIQGEWWHEDGSGGRVVQPYPFGSIKGVGSAFVIMTPLYHPDEPSIEPIFKYPSREHWGEYADWFKP